MHCIDEDSVGSFLMINDIGIAGINIQLCLPLLMEKI
jgi:hypothetical protein